MKVTPIITVGMAKGDTLLGVPFFHVEIDGKRLFVNYSFGEITKGCEPELVFENEAGRMKEQLFRSILPHGPFVTGFFDKTGDEIEEALRVAAANAPDGARLLFVWPRGEIDDTPFYRFIGFNAQKPDFTKFEAKTLKQLGYMVKPPFMEIDPDTMEIQS